MGYQAGDGQVVPCVADDGPRTGCFIRHFSANGLHPIDVIYLARLGEYSIGVEHLNNQVGFYEHEEAEES